MKMVLVNFRENIQLLLKLKESLIPQIDGNFINDWESEAKKYQNTSENILVELKEIRFIEGFVTAISSQLIYLRNSLSNYSFMTDSEKDQFKRLYVLAALGLIAKLKLIMFFSTYIDYNDNTNYIRDFNLNDTYFSNIETNNNYGNEYKDSKEYNANKNKNNSNIYNLNTSIINSKSYHNNIINNNNNSIGQNGINTYDDYITGNNLNDYDIQSNYNNKNYFADNKGETDIDNNINENNIYSKHNKEYINNSLPYNTISMNKNMYEYNKDTEIMRVMDMNSFHNRQMMHAENINETNDIIVTEGNANIKEFAVNNQPTINMTNTSFTNEQINNYKKFLFSNIYNYNPEKTEAAAQRIYELLTDMKPFYRTPSSSVSSTVSSAYKNSYNFNREYYIPNNQYYQMNNENNHIKQMPQCFQAPNLVESMHGSSAYY